VKAAYDALNHAGVINPNAKNVRDYLLTRVKPGQTVGSYSTIGDILKRIYPKDSNVFGIEDRYPDVPDAVTKAVQIALGSIAHTTKLACVSELDSCKSQIADLREENLGFEEHIDYLSAELERCGSERDGLSGQLLGKATELDEQKNRFSIECDARIDLQNRYSELNLQHVLLGEKLRDFQEKEVLLIARLEEQKCEFLERERLQSKELTEVRILEVQGREGYLSAQGTIEMLKIRLEGLDTSLTAERARNSQLLEMLKSSETLVASSAASDATVRELRVQLALLKDVAFPNSRVDKFNGLDSLDAG
jgi:hypothetical protein